MEIQKIFDKKLKRKNFFYSIGAGIAGYTIMKSFPLNFLSKRFSNNNKENKKIKIRINPLAVSRQKTGKTNGRS